jgi:hypothetical protein
MTIEQENESLRARVTELETACRNMRTGLANLLTIVKEYGGGFLKTYQSVMSKRDAEDAGVELSKKYDFTKDPDKDN